VPEATMAQRISRAKRALQGRRLDQPGDLAVVLRVLYLIYTAGSPRHSQQPRYGVEKRQVAACCQPKIADVMDHCERRVLAPRARPTI
jgi:predicted RNA polymerase sigma factor